MKILMLLSGSIHSSLSNRPLSLARELAAGGHDVTLMAPRADKYSNFQPDALPEIDGVTCAYPRQWHNRFGVMNLVPYLFSSLAQVLRRRPDVVIIFKPTPITITGLAAKWRYGSHVILDMDDLGSEVMRIEHQSALMCRLVEWCENLSARQADAIMAASTMLENDFRRRFPEKTVLRLPNGVDPHRFVPGHLRRPNRLIFFGSLNRERIMRPLFEAMPAVIKACPDVQLDILGDGRYRGKFETLCHDLGISDHVNFTGWIDHDQLASRMSADDIGICLMPDERTTAACSNQKIFEYMAMKMAIVATTVGDLPLYLEEGRAGVLVQPDNPTDLSAALIGLLQHTETRRRLAHQGRSLAETTYSWSTLAGQVDNLLGATS